MPKISRIDELGSNKEKQVLTNAEQILDGTCTILNPYESGKKEIVLSFSLEDENVAINKQIVKIDGQIIDSKDVPLETVYITQIELREEGEVFLEKTLHKFLSLKEIEKSKAVPKMSEHSKDFEKMVSELTLCDSETALYELQKQISKEISLFKKSNDDWIQSH